MRKWEMGVEGEEVVGLGGGYLGDAKLNRGEGTDADDAGENDGNLAGLELVIQTEQRFLKICRRINLPVADAVDDAEREAALAAGEGGGRRRAVMDGKRSKSLGCGY
jgi:hypothetical protein